MTPRPFSHIPNGVRIVWFDAVGTLLHPEPSAGDVYFEIGARFGSRLDREEVRRRFGNAFKRQEQEDVARGLQTNEAHERTRWWRIVSDVLDDVTDQAACFETLFQHFASRSSWQWDSMATTVVKDLEEAGYRVGIASNFDRRLRHIVHGSVLDNRPALAISSEVGWKKPAPQFFASLHERPIRCPPEEVLLVGDDVENDFLGARENGLHALLLDPLGRYPLFRSHSIRSLAELVGRVESDPPDESAG
jgi:putative hydrolase of the HAD superfamily